jgi:hypothetical protein
LLPMHRRFRNMFFTTVDSQRGRQPTPTKEATQLISAHPPVRNREFRSQGCSPSLFLFSSLTLTESLVLSLSLSLTSKLTPMENTVSPLPLCQN